MSLFHDSALVGASGQGGAAGYLVERSLRFNSSDSAYLSRTPASAGNRTAWSWSAWIKRTDRFDSANILFGYLDATGNTGQFVRFLSDSTLDFSQIESGSYTARLITTQVFRDPGAWFHLLVVWDSANGTANSRHRIYINGTEVTTFATRTNPSSSLNSQINTAVEHAIGTYGVYKVVYTSAYYADIHFIDGQALTPSSFTEVSATTGQLIPKQYTGSFGTNGFWLKFSDNSAATATTLGKDYSGNSNNWTPNNFSVLSSYTDTFLSRKPDGTSWTNPTYAFDGTTANYADGTAGNGTVSTIRFNKPLTGVTLLEYFYDGTSTYGYNSTDVGTGPNLTGGSWVTVYSGSAITVNNVRCTSQPGNGVIRLYAIRVNGTILNNWTETDPPGCDSTVDTPSSAGTDTGLGGEVTGNYCTLNPLNRNSNANLSNGNLNFSLASAGVNYGTFATFGVRTGKWYFEASIDSFISYGITTGFVTSDWGRDYIGSGGTAYFGLDTTQGRRSSAGITASGSTVTYAAGDVVGVAFNADAGTATIYKNGASVYTFSGIPANDYFPALSSGGSSAWINFGQRPFAYPAPSGFKALCDTNLPAPVVAKPNTVMDVLLWSGDSTKPRTFSGLNFDPDLIWVKARSDSYNHWLQDSVRGFTTGKKLRPNGTDAEGTGEALDIYGYVSGSSSTGFTIDGTGTTSQLGQSNLSGQTYVGWTWDAGSSTATNTQGSITSSVRANASAGFSIVTYTGTGSAGTVGHGLGVAPTFIICKSRSFSPSNWMVGHGSLGWTQVFEGLNTTSAASTSSASWNNTAPTSTVFTVGTESNVNGSGRSQLAYCFAPVAGYSSFGSYTGNGSADGPFVYTGFRPRWVLIKESSASGNNWNIWDAARDDYNVTAKQLKASASDAEGTNTFADFTSNGFKIRASTSGINASGATHVWAAFAESPFQYARAR